MSNANNTNTNNVIDIEENVGLFGRIRAAITSPMAKTIGVAVLSAGAGAAGGYYFARNKGCVLGMSESEAKDIVAAAMPAAKAGK